MLRECINRNNSSITSVNLVSFVSAELCEIDSKDMNSIDSDSALPRLQNSDMLDNPEQKLSHLEPRKGI